jgi:hypothetical protein
MVRDIHYLDQMLTSYSSNANEVLFLSKWILLGISIRLQAHPFVRLLQSFMHHGRYAASS